MSSVRRVGGWLVAAAVMTCASCASTTYRIPGAEMQRLAQLNVAERGTLVRVMPPDQSTEYLAAVPAAPPRPVQPADEPPATPAIAESQPVYEQGVIIDQGPTFGGNGSGDVVIDVGPAPRPGPRVPDRRMPPSAPTVRSTALPRVGGGSNFSPPVVTPVIRAAPINGGGPSITRAGMGGAMARGSSPGVARLPAPGSFHVSGGHSGGSGGGHSGGGHSGGSFSGGDAVAVVLAVVIVIGLIAVIAEAASEEPPPFDGWAEIPPDHPVHLRYAHDVERTIKLRDLRPQDLVGLKDTIVKDSEGALVRLPPDADQRIARGQPLRPMNAAMNAAPEPVM